MSTCGTSCLTQLVELLRSHPPHTRSELMMEVVSFRPGHNLERIFSVGPIRAAFAACWEQSFGTPVPLKELRVALEPPIPIKTVLAFSVLGFAEDAAAVESSLTDLMAHLAKCIPPAADHQQLLFADLMSSETPTLERLPIGERVSDLQELVKRGRKFSTVYADPPWDYDNEASRGAAINHYPTMSVEQICQEPVSTLVASDAHLHLWTTNGHLRQAFDVMDAWGFTFKSCLVWVKDQIGMGNYWRVSHEFLLLGLRGQLPFRERSIQSWFQSPRTAHSRKPAVVRTLIERVSPGPYLELFGREELRDSAWTVHGNQVERRLF